jgi:TatD DNase family protein
MRGKRNEPSFTKFVVEKIAVLKSLHPDIVAKETTKNFINLFKKANISIND